jgi:anthranilate synthase component 1
VIRTTKPEFLELAKSGMRVPVFQDLLADFETPLSAYWKLCANEPYSFLFESVTGGEHLARYSILGTRPRCILKSKNKQLTKIQEGKTTTRELAEGEDPLHALEAELLPTLSIPGMPKFEGGAVGMLAYDIVRFFERLPDSNPDDLQLDDMAMMLEDAVVVFDHAKNIIRVVVNAAPTEEGYESACQEITRIVNILKGPLPELPYSKGEKQEVTSNFKREDFEKAVARASEYILAGDALQIVPSQRFSTKCTAHPLSVYRALRSLNPSPYMFLMRFGDYDLVGASPEILVGVQNRIATVRPIAGTRKRGKTQAEDLANEQELLADEKERAEHIMLVDLGRNDLGRVSKIGSVKVDDLMVIERYSHVMHIVSEVCGELLPEKSGFDVVRSCFPAGTVTGAPKVRAMQIIDELEPSRRGLYAGAVGYFGANGNLDLSIAIRSILIKNGTAHVQAGGGVVADSQPWFEYEESVNKAKACLKALEIAETGEL